MADSTTDNRREENSTVYGTAIKLSIRLNHHLFDTPYHATALHMPEAIDVTADRRHYDKAKDLGQIAFLAEFDLSLSRC